MIAGINPVQALGIIVIIVAAIGGGVKLGGGEFPVINSIPRAILLAIIGIVLVVYGPTWIDRWDRFRVVAVSVNWDQDSGNACNSTEGYSISIETAGGGGEVSYSLVLDGKRYNQKPFETDEPKTYSIPGTVSFPYRKGSLTESTSTLKVEVTSPNNISSEVSVMNLTCEESTADLINSLNQFSANYAAAVKKYGRSSSAVTSNFFGYPLDWYGRPQSNEDDFVCYLEHCHDSRPKGSHVNTTAGCTYQPAVVRQILASGEHVKYQSTVDWTSSSGRAGQTIVAYEVDRSDSGELFRIRSVDQTRKSETCS